MKNDILFSERQKVTQWWIWLFVILANLFFLYGWYFFNNTLHKPPFHFSWSNLFSLVFNSLIISYLVFFRVETQVKGDGIYVRSFPYQFKFTYYSWDRISKLYLRKYSSV